MTAPSPERPATPLLPWRFGVFLLLTMAIPLLVAPLGLSQAILVGFDGAALVFMLTLPRLFAQGDAAVMRVHSRQNDANRPMLLILTVAILATIMVAVALQLSDAPDRFARLLVIVTLFVAWLFTNLIFALHYAHIYYLADVAGDARGAEFPGGAPPTYWDFAYFACILGMTFQTSDVNITSVLWRKTVLGHSVAAFIFNIGVIAFTINLLAR